MARKDDSVVKREEFLAALRSLEPVSEPDGNSAGSAKPGEQETVIAAIADGVRSQVEQAAQDHDKMDDSEQRPGSAIAPMATAERDVAEARSPGALEAGFTFEEMVREAVGRELRTWLNENLQPMTERIVREEIRAMGQRRRREKE